MQALVRPLAEHDALQQLTPMRRAATNIIDNAEAFERLVAELPVDVARIKSVAAARQQVWWDVLERYPHLAVWVAGNRSASVEVLAHLAVHGDMQTRLAVASAAGLSEEAMLQLAHDHDDLVRMRVACNPQTSRNALGALVDDPCTVVRKHAQARLAHDLSGTALPPSYLDDISMVDLHLLH